MNKLIASESREREKKARVSLALQLIYEKNLNIMTLNFDSQPIFS